MSDTKLIRPQDPIPPYPYIQEEVTYPNQADDITVAGTLTLPNAAGNFPAVILISGTGPNDRNYTMLGHKPFLVLADYLTRHGIAVLRVDKRGVGASTGIFDGSVTSKDLARDVHAGIAYLKTRKEIDPHRIGLIGHSEGGMIAAIVASQSKDVSYVVLMAGVMTTEIEHVLTQVAMQLKADGAPQELIEYDAKIWRQLLLIGKQESDSDKAAAAMRVCMAAYFAELPKPIKIASEQFMFAIKESKTESMILFLSSPAYRYWLWHNPAADVRKLHIPVLALHGDLDFVTVSPIHLPIIEKALRQAGNKDITIVEMPKMNHWFQSCATGAMSEYGSLQETISPLVLKQIADWIAVRFGTKK